MSKVKCEDCAFWLFCYKKRRLKKGAMISLSFNYEEVSVGVCTSGKCAAETSGYTGLSSGHKMNRIGETLRYCAFFNPKEEKTHDNIKK